MFGLEYIAALVKVLFNVAFSIVTAIPFYFAWNCIAPVYLDFIPKVYHALPYWHIVGIFLICTYLGEQIAKLTPTLISIKQTNSGD
jgi:hypothetical protein